MQLKEFISIGCSDKEVLYRLRPNGKVQMRPPCADCEAREVDCFDCPDEDNGCKSWPGCHEDCMFTDICEEDRPPKCRVLCDCQEEIVDRTDMDIHYTECKCREAIEEPNDSKPGSLSFKLKSFYVDRIDNGFIVYYKIDTTSHKRHCQDIESLCRFIKQHTR